VGSGFSGTLWMQYSQGTQTGLISQIGTIKAQVTQSAAASNPVLYTVTFYYGQYIASITANGVLTSNGATVSYQSGNTISITATTSTGPFGMWSASSGNLVLGGIMSNPTTLTINGDGTLTASGQGGVSCFTLGTPVMTLTGNEPIQNVTNGTIVYSFNAISGAIMASKVTRTLVEFDYYIYNITTAFGKVATPADQSFYVGNNTFVRAGDLTVGEEIGIYQNDTIVFTKIRSINVSYAPQLTYNLEVNRTHTFFANGFAVHNVCP
jgi:hypothetical protein